MKHLPIILVSLFAALCICSCRDNDDTITDIGEFRYDVVTFNDYTDGVAHYTYIPRNDNEEIIYEGRMTDEPACEDGVRVLLSYYTTGDVVRKNGKATQQIVINGAANITTDTLRYAVKERIDTMTRDDIRLTSIWRTGNYLNIHGEVESTGKPRWFYLAMDKATWSNDTVECYLINNPFGYQTYFWRQFYASFYIGGAWKKSTCRVLRVHLNDKIFPDTHEYCFSKQ